MAMFSYKLQPWYATGWILLPLRLFLGVTFIYAGIQKLTDPQFFAPSARGYIGKQILGFATGSPLHAFLINVAVPHASFFGYLVAYGEIAIGLGTLLGLLLRPATFFGMLISLMFFLSATWHVFPYFYGSDIVFVFCWLTMLLAGPTNTGLPSLDGLWVRSLLARMPSEEKKRYTPVLAFCVGVSEKQPVASTQEFVQEQGKRLPAGASKRPAQKSRYSPAQYARESRRNFIWGIVTGGGAMLVVAWFWNLTHTSGSNATVVPTTGDGGSASGGANATPVTAGSGSTIAQVSQVPNNSSVNFTLASNGDPGILVRLNSGQFVAYDATCTHAGCPVDYDPGSQMLICPCHGATFDPSKSANVVQGPASTPLTNVPINVDNATGNITLQ